MFYKLHKYLEKKSFPLLLGIIGVVSVGGLVEIAPLFYIDSTIEEVEGMRPYTPLELSGRNIYIREGCYVCHSQMVRPLRDEVERYGHYSLAAESMYDRPFQWGSKRTGPDLARVGGKYSDEWHKTHLIDPRSVVPESIMPPYAFLEDAELEYEDVSEHLLANRRLGRSSTRWLKTMTACWNAIPMRRFGISMARAENRPKWMRSLPICKWSGR